MKRAFPLLVVVLITATACQSGMAVLPTAALEEAIGQDFPAKDAVEPGTLTGQVVNESGPVVGAVVRQKATENFTITDHQGTFILQDLPQDQPLTITAWAEGYFVGWVEILPGEISPVTISIKPYYTYDNHEYNWFSAEGEDGSASCAHCMPCYEEWQEDAHSRSAVNPRFLSMYNGSDLSGNTSPLTRITNSSDYGFIPLPPDPNQPYYGPGYKLDFPETAGNCAACHVPAQAAHPGMAYGADPNLADGIELEGVFCEFCHKIGAVVLDPATQLPYPNMPGVLSIQLYRPAGEDQLFFGNFDDVTRRVSKLPLESESAFCAACHYGVFWDVVIYNSYGEWLDSPYSDPENGRTCQDCHMAPVDYDYFVYPEQGGEIRNRSGIFSHYMPGAADQEFLADAAELEVMAVVENGLLAVDALVVNDNTGHKLPTDSPLRQLLLVVEAFNEDGEPLLQLDGPQIPAWGGSSGSPEQGYFADLPGRGYALILREQWTGISPTGAYWNPVVVEEDSRLDPFQEDFSQYLFQSEEAKQVQVRVRLIFRRAFKSLMDQKGWTDPDIVMEEVWISIPD